MGNAQPKQNQPLTRPASADENAGSGTPSPQGRGLPPTVGVLSRGRKGKDLRCTHYFLIRLGRSPLELSPGALDSAFWMICKSVAASAAWKV